jgi:tRNA (cytidine/uridine-2'-O-)-methyltransferase
MPGDPVNEPFNVVLIEPEIPPNTGNIARLCGATNAVLHLVGKLGFSLDDKHLKRAGLDYWDAVDIRRWDSFAELLQVYPDKGWWYASKKAEKSYLEAEFKAGDFLVFGKETLGLPEEMLARNAERAIRIPISNPAVRSFNLANAVAIILHEAIRQSNVASRA